MSDASPAPVDQPGGEQQRPGTTPEEASEVSLDQEESSDCIEQLQEELAEANNRMLRAQAELENFRKRAHREMENERRYAALPLVRDLLTVIDNLQLAINAAEENENASGLLEGVKMVASQLDSVLAQHQCRPIDTAGQPFDPNYHEAVASEPSDEHPHGSIARVTRVGYQLHDRIVRPSQVYVSSGPATQQQPSD